MKIICVGRNYIDHAKEMDSPVPDEPMLFMKPATALLREDRAFYIPEFSNEIHYELELVYKICKNGKYIAKEFAHSYYDEISLGIDFTARDLQKKLKAKGHPWEISKGFDHSAVIGKWATCPTGEKQFSLLKNGKKVQSGSSEDMIFSIDDLIVHMSKFFKLQIGDLIYTGTPAGVGPVQIGDVLEGFLGEEKLLHCEVK